MNASSRALTVEELYHELQETLQLQWVAGRNGGDRSIAQDNQPKDRPNLLGLLNLLSPNRIQLLGSSELSALFNSSEDQQSLATEQLFNQSCRLVVIADGASPPERMQRLANQSDTALITSPLPINSLINTLGQYLTRRFSDTVTLHGVMMEVLGIGVLITGDSSVGKSELALELVSRGHTLVADDAPEFRKIAHNRIEGSCPRLLRNFLEVRGLGVLNIQRMYGHASTRYHKILRFIVRLEIMGSDRIEAQRDRLHNPERTCNVLGVEISELSIPVAPGRNLAVLVEAAVRNYLLRGDGYDSAVDFENRHKRLLDAADGS